MLKISQCFVGASLALVMACACDKGAKTGGGSTGASAGALVGDDPKAVVARYQGKTLTLADLVAKDPDKMFEAEETRYNSRKQVLDRIVVEDLVKAEADKVGKTADEWVRAQVKPPADAEVQAFFEANKEQMPPGTTLDQVRPRIVDFMTGDQVRAVIEELKKKSNVEIVMAAPHKPKKEVEAKGPARGPEGAKVTIVEFSDFQCPFCARAHDTVEEVMAAYAGKVRLVFRQFPLEFHAMAPKAAEAALCANEQQHFWDFHDAMFKNQQKLQPDDLKATAVSLGLDASKFNECLDSGRMASVVKTDQEAGAKAGVNGTPAFFINGTMISGAQPMEEFKKIIDAELATN